MTFLSNHRKGQGQVDEDFRSLFLSRNPSIRLNKAVFPESKGYEGKNPNFLSTSDII
jgi:hypothetical protein